MGVFTWNTHKDDIEVYMKNQASELVCPNPERKYCITPILAFRVIAPKPGASGSGDEIPGVSITVQKTMKRESREYSIEGCPAKIIRYHEKK